MNPSPLLGGTSSTTSDELYESFSRGTNDPPRGFPSPLLRCSLLSCPLPPTLHYFHSGFLSALKAAEHAEVRTSTLSTDMDHPKPSSHRTCRHFITGITEVYNFSCPTKTLTFVVPALKKEGQQPSLGWISYIDKGQEKDERSRSRRVDVSRRMRWFAVSKKMDIFQTSVGLRCQKKLAQMARTHFRKRLREFKDWAKTCNLGAGALNFWMNKRRVSISAFWTWKKQIRVTRS